MCVCIYRKLVSVFHFSDIFSIFLVFFSLFFNFYVCWRMPKRSILSLRLLAHYKTLTFNAEKGWGSVVVGWKNINTRNCLFVCLRFSILRAYTNEGALLLESMWGQ